MSDRADKPSEQRPIARLSELQTSQFISDALRAGRRAILVTGRGQASTRVPEAALSASGSASARALHIGPPLPEPPELQEMIGSAVGVAGGREMTPQAMAQRLRLADPRPSVILAIDDAHTLSHRSLGYLTLMTGLLASEAPILQIVLAANPSLLDTLAQPEFEGLRNSLSRPIFETIQSLRGKRAHGVHLGLRKATYGGATTLLGHVQNGGPAELLRRGHGIARPAVRIALVAVSGLAAIVYIALGPTPEPIPPLNSDARQRFLAPTGPSQPLAQLAPGQLDETIDPLIDQTVDAVASGSVELTSTLLERIAKLDSGALMPALDDRLAARMSAAAAAGRSDEAGRMEEVYVLAYSAVGRRDPLTASNQRSFQSPRTAIPGTSNINIGGSAQRRETAQEPGFPPSGSVSAEQPGAAGDGDREGLSPNAAPAPPSDASEQNVDVASPAILAKVTPPHSPSTHSAEQLGAAVSGDREGLSPNAAPAPPNVVPDQTVDETPPPIAANSPPLDSPSKLSADQVGAARNGDHAPLSPGAAALLAPASADPEQNVDRARVAMLAKAAPITPGDHKAQVAAALPALAPVRVVLNVARGDLSHAADIQHALVAAGVQADLVPVDARRPTPSIGYYFQSDRDAAAGLSHLLTPLLGDVDPVALRIRGSIPEPGTIEIAVP
jgi:hypothetical protein